MRRQVAAAACSRARATAATVAVVVALQFLLAAAGDGTAAAEGAPPQGHLQPLGANREPVGQVEVLDGFPTPAQFWEHYVRPSRPVVFKGAARRAPAFSLWTDAYLKERYGEEEVFFEPAKLEVREAAGKTASFASFLAAYMTEDIYLVHNVPESMQGDLELPSPLQCGGFQDHLTETIAWYSSGGTSSVLHNDDFENINCVMAGEKTLLMYDRKYVETMESRMNWFPNGSYSALNVSKVDMFEYSALNEMGHLRVNLKAGDCLYIPYLWYHQVRSFNRNIAVNVWWEVMAAEEFDPSDCAGVDLESPKPLSSFPFVPPDDEGDDEEGEGNERTEEGDYEWTHGLGLLDRLFDMAEEEPVTEAEFELFFSTYEVGDDALVSKWFSDLDADEDGAISHEEMGELDHSLEDIGDAIVELAPQDLAPPSPHEEL